MQILTESLQYDYLWFTFSLLWASLLRYKDSFDTLKEKISQKFRRLCLWREASHSTSFKSTFIENQRTWRL